MSNKYLRIIIFTVSAFVLGISCSRKPSKEQLNKQIVKYEGLMKVNLGRSGEPVVPQNNAKKLLSIYHQYVTMYPKDEKAPSYLFASAMLEAETFHKYHDCIDILYKLRKNYPDNDYAEKSLFLIGYTYAEKVKDFQRARAVFTQFLEKYPKSPFVPSVKFELKNMGKPADSVFPKKSSGKS